MNGKLGCWFIRGTITLLIFGVFVAPALGLSLLVERSGPGWNIDLGGETHDTLLRIPDELPRTTVAPNDGYASLLASIDFAAADVDGRDGALRGASFDHLTSGLHAIWGFDDPTRGPALAGSDSPSALDAERDLALRGQTDVGRLIQIRHGQQQKSFMRREPTIQPIPEPASLVLLLAGLLGIGAVGRRKEA